MKKLFFVLLANFIFSLITSAQTKKDGTPDMRYKANKETYKNTYSPPQQTTSPSMPSSPVETSPRPIYSSQTHTTSHGGDYPGSTNEHHKNGHYVNPNSDNRYGIHKTKKN